MDTASFSHGNTVKNKASIIALTSASVFFAILSIVIGAFVPYIYYTFANYFIAALSICIKLLLIFYVAWLHRCKRSEIAVIIVYAHIVLSTLISLVFAMFTGASINILGLFSHVLTFLSFSALLILTLLGLKSKAAPIVAASVVFVFAVISIISIVSNYRYFGNVYLFCNIFSIISNITYHIALLIFGLSSTVQPTVKVGRKECAKEAELSPEEKLALLKEKHELKIISDDEYAAEKHEIIEMLINTAKTNES